MAWFFIYIYICTFLLLYVDARALSFHNNKVDQTLLKQFPLNYTYC